MINNLTGLHTKILITDFNTFHTISDYMNLPKCSDLYLILTFLSSNYNFKPHLSYVTFLFPNEKGKTKLSQIPKISILHITRIDIFP